jgi:hypothetical protein
VVALAARFARTRIARSISLVAKARESLKALMARLKLSPSKASMMEFRGIPPFPQKKAERMGHGDLFVCQHSFG